MVYLHKVFIRFYDSLVSAHKILSYSHRKVEIVLAFSLMYELFKLKVLLVSLKASKLKNMKTVFRLITIKIHAVHHNS